MKKIFAFVFAAFICTAVYAQENVRMSFYKKYLRMIELVGYDGIGVENLIEKWEKADSTDINLYVAKFNYYFKHSSRDTVITLNQEQYLGDKPSFSLYDSLDRKTNYFKDRIFDESLFSLAIKNIDKAIRLDNSRLDINIIKANALLAYEKEKPDLTEDFLCALVGKNSISGKKWTYPGETVTDEFFFRQIQDFCYTFYVVSSETSLEAMKAVSEKVLACHPNNVTFLDNIGAYYAKTGNRNKALKYFKKALKIDPADDVATQNIRVLTSSSKKKKK